jgi:hypothetical protein
MNIRARFVVICIAVTALLTNGAAAIAAPLTSISAFRAGCPASDIASGACVGFFGPAGSDPRMDALTGLVQQGKAAQAATLARDWGMSTSRPTSQPASQVDDGLCCATTYVHWELEPTLWNWGACGSNGCTVAGVIDIDTTDDVTTFPASVFYQRLQYYNGVVPTFSAYSVTMWQDILNKSDPKVGTYTCPKAGSTIYCTATVASPRTVANWYYIEIKFSVVAAGWPTVVEIYESRRWQVHNASQASFEAYYNGG